MVQQNTSNKDWWATCLEMWRIYIAKHLICSFSTIRSLLPVSRLLNWRFQSRVILSSLTQQAIQVLASVLLDFGIAQANGWWDCVTNTWTQWVVLQTRLRSSRAPLHQTHPAGQTARCTWRLLERRRQRLRWRTGLSPRCGTDQTRYIHNALGNNIISCESKQYCSYMKSYNADIWISLLGQEERKVQGWQVLVLMRFPNYLGRRQQAGRGGPPSFYMGGTNGTPLEQSRHMNKSQF